MNAKHIPDITLERYLLNELTPDVMERIRETMKADPLLRKRIEQINESNGKILRRYRPETIVPRIIEWASLSGIAPAPGRRFSRAMVLVPSMAAVAAVAVLVLFPIIRSGNDTIPDPFMNDVTRVKGTGAQLYVYRKSGSGAEQLSAASKVRDRDLLQIAYYSAEDTHGVILSLDGRGTVTQHYPASPSRDTRIEKNRKIFLRSSYELDDAPGFERFIFISSRSPLDARALYRAAEKLAASPGRAKKAELSIDTGSRQTSLVLLKD
ncbi:MAG: hypothetical protein KA369_06625 [Spirochaetes bacterium]|nr:hypothetical protein [Spirochaetota bacterium]